MYVCFNGEFFSSGLPLLPVQNRSYKWGDGVFETIKVFDGKLLLQALHFERLFISLQLLQINVSNRFTPANLAADIVHLCQQNNCLAHARVRLAVYRNDDNTAGYSAEASPLPDTASNWQEQGLQVVLYPFARKSMDAFANLKSANFLPYVLAQRYAAEKGADDALVLNAHNFFSDSSKANLFLLKGKNLYTPALHQGCVNGVMRRVVIDEAKRLGYRLYQDEVDEALLLAADEVFLTNAIQTIRWVQQYKSAVYGGVQTRKLFEAVKATIFNGRC